MESHRIYAQTVDTRLSLRGPSSKSLGTRLPGWYSVRNREVPGGGCVEYLVTDSQHKYPDHSGSWHQKHSPYFSTNKLSLQHNWDTSHNRTILSLYTPFMHYALGGGSESVRAYKMLINISTPTSNTVHTDAHTLLGAVLACMWVASYQPK